MIRKTSSRSITKVKKTRPVVDIIPAYDITSFELSKKLSKLFLGKKGIVNYNENGKIILLSDSKEAKYPAYCLEQLLDILPGEVDKIPLVLRKHLLIGYLEKCDRSPLGYYYLCCEPVRYRESLVETVGRLIIRMYHNKILVCREKKLSDTYLYNLLKTL